MDKKQIVEVLEQYTKEDGVIDLETAAEALEETLNGERNETEGAKGNGEEITIEDIAKMSPEEIEKNIEAIKAVLNNLSQTEINEHWETVQTLLKGLK